MIRVSPRLNYPEVVRIGPNNAILASAFAPFMKRQEYRHVALIADDTAFGRGLGGTIQATATLAGIDIASQEFKRDAHDLRPTLKRVLARKPRCARDRRSPDHARRALWASRRRARPASRATSCSAWDYIDDALLEGDGKARRRRHLADVLAADAASHLGRADLQAALHEEYKHAPLFYQALTWDQLNAWKWAVDTVGSVAPADVIPTLPRIDMQGTDGPHHALEQAGHGALQPVGWRHGLLRPGDQEGRDGFHTRR